MLVIKPSLDGHVRVTLEFDESHENVNALTWIELDMKHVDFWRQDF